MESVARLDGLRNGLRSWKVRGGLIIVGLFGLLAIFGPVVYTKNPSALSSAVLQGPSWAHPLGTTQTGQDVLAQFIDGTRISMAIGFGAGALATLLSLLVGVSAGYLGGASDEILSTLANIFLVIPGLPLVIVLAGYLPSKGVLSVAAVIAVTGWAWGARVLRAQTLSLRRRDFVVAARATGERPLRVVFSEILPNQLAIVAADFLGTVIYAVLLQASLAFLGLGSATTWSWGTMLYWAESNQALQVNAWWWFVPPGLALAILGMGLALINFGIDEFVNPRLRVARVGTKSAGRTLRAEGMVLGRRGSRPEPRASVSPRTFRGERAVRSAARPNWQSPAETDGGGQGTVSSVRERD